MTGSADSQPATLDLPHFLPYQLSLVSNTISEALAEVYCDPHQLSITEWRLLAVLADQPGISASQLVRQTHIAKVAISRALKRLLARGLVRRTTIRSDRRQHKLRLSTAGENLYAEIAPRVRTRERELLAGLSREDREQLGAILERLLQTLQVRTIGEER